MDIRVVETCAAQEVVGLRDQLVDCWVVVSDAGGAVGFPHPPVDPAEVAAALDGLLARLGPDATWLLVALDPDDRVVGWLALVRGAPPLRFHTATIRRLQARPELQGTGIGTLLIHRARDLARRLGLEQLQLTARGGLGLEGFYGRLGFREVGRVPGALRVAPGDDRDEVLLLLAPL